MRAKVDFKSISEHVGPEQSPGFLLWRVSTAWRRSLELVLKPFDLTHPQFVVLATVGWLTRTGETINQVQIARQVDLDPNTISQILRGLQAKGLLARKHEKDERSKSPQITLKGADILAQVLPVIEQADAQFFAPLKSEQKQIIEHLQVLAKLKSPKRSS